MTFRELGHFCGTELSDFDKKEGYVSYKTLADAMGSIVLCNNIAEVDENLEVHQFPSLSEMTDEEHDEYLDNLEVFQYFIIDGDGVNLLERFAPDEIIYYSPLLDVYVWGVTHWGTSWSIVPTEISIDEEL